MAKKPQRQPLFGTQPARKPNTNPADQPFKKPPVTGRAGSKPKPTVVRI